MIVADSENTWKIAGRLTEAGAPRSMAARKQNSGASLAVAYDQTPHLALVDYSPSQGLTVRRRLDLPERPRRVFAADYNSDGILDWLVLGDSLGTLTIFAGQNNGEFQEGQTITLGSDTLDVQIGDLENRGQMQLAALSRASAQISIYSILQNGLLFPRSSLSVDKGTNALTLGRLDSDPYPDAAVINPEKNNATLFFSNGKSGLNVSQTLSLAGKPTSILAYDMDGDGRDDLVITLEGGNFVLIDLNKDLQNPFRFDTVLRPQAAAVGDANGDGLPDFAVIGSEEANVTVYLSRGPVAVQKWRWHESK